MIKYWLNFAEEGDDVPPLPKGQKDMIAGLVGKKKGGGQGGGGGDDKGDEGGKDGADGTYEVERGKEPQPKKEGEEEEEEEPEPEGEEEEEKEEEGEPVDLTKLDRGQLKQHIKDNKLEITVYKNWTEDDIRAKIQEAEGQEEEEPDIMETLKTLLDIEGIEPPPGEKGEEEEDGKGGEGDKVNPQEFVTKDEFEEFFEDRDKLNLKLSTIYDRAVKEGVKQALEQFEGNVSSLVDKKVKLSVAVSNFWSKNEDLAPVANLVAKKATKVQGQHPDWSVAKIYNEAGKEVRSAIAVLQKNKKRDKTDKKSFASPPKGRVGAPGGGQPKLKGEQGKIQELMNKTKGD